LHFVVEFTFVYLLPSPSYEKRVKDISSIKVALEEYKKDHGAFPVANYSRLINEKFLIDENWIPGLSPKYIQVLPRDVRMDNIPSHQYLYVSDGFVYKIIAHGVDDMEGIRKRHPNMIDPRRPGHAFGFWSFGGEGL
jgi:hypothetical protein